MMAENYCTMRVNMLVLNMVQQGVFGDITLAECGYIHDVRDLAPQDAVNLTWRGRMFMEWLAMAYPSHSIGPVAQWLGINRVGGDRFTEISTMISKVSSVAAYYKERFGADHPGAAKPAAWESLWQYVDEYEHPLWRQWLDQVLKSGHGGGDFFVLGEFADAIRNHRRPAIYVYDAVTWSAVTPLSAASVGKGARRYSFRTLGGKGSGPWWVSAQYHGPPVEGL